MHAVECIRIVASRGSRPTVVRTDVESGGASQTEVVGCKHAIERLNKEVNAAPTSPVSFPTTVL